MVKIVEQDRRRGDVESISKIGDSKFNNFRKRHLDVGILSDDNLEAIRRIVGADRGGNLL